MMANHIPPRFRGYSGQLHDELNLVARHEQRSRNTSLRSAFKAAAVTGAIYLIKPGAEVLGFPVIALPFLYGAISLLDTAQAQYNLVRVRRAAKNYADHHNVTIVP